MSSSSSSSSGNGRRNKQTKRRRQRKGNAVAKWAQASSHTHNFMQRATVCSVPPRVQLFPEEFHCYGKTQVQLVGLGISGVTETFKLNGPFNLFGPQVNSTGAFAANVPAGSYYLLSSNAATGSNAPYGRATVLSTKVDIELIGISSNTIPISLVMYPSSNPSVSGLAVAIWREQKGAVYSELSYNATTALKLSSVVDTGSVFGVSKSIVRQSPDFSQAPGVDPANLCYYHIYVASMDGSTVGTWYANVTFTHELVFRNINTFATTPPT